MSKTENFIPVDFLLDIQHECVTIELVWSQFISYFGKVFMHLVHYTLAC